MSNRRRIQRRWMAKTARVRNERGVSMVEYTIIIALIAVTVMFALPYLGGAINDQLGTGGLSVRHGDYVVDNAPEKKGGDVNQNGDNYVCIKGDPQGEGNTGNNSNNKDNNSDPVDNG
jgi:Flp pilus assembly pilin Flp